MTRPDTSIQDEASNENGPGSSEPVKTRRMGRDEDVAQNRESIESLALQALLPITVFVYVASLVILTFLGQDYPIDNQILSLATGVASGVVALVVIGTVFWRRKRAEQTASGAHMTLINMIGSTLTIAIGYALAAGVFVYAVMAIFGAAFKGIHYIPLIAAISPAVASAVITYWGVRVGAFAQLTNIMRLVGVYLVAGVLIGGIANPNPHWWKISISYLGMKDITSAKVFNITIMIAAALFLASNTFTFPEFEKAAAERLITRRTRIYLRVVFIFSPIGLFLVGACPYGSSSLNTFLHDFGSYGMFALMAVTMVLTRRLFPFFDSSHVRANYALLALFLVLLGFYAIPPHALALGLFEALGIAIIAVWLILTLTAVENRVAKCDPPAPERTPS